MKGSVPSQEQIKNKGRYYSPIGAAQTPAWEEITRLAAQICHTPWAGVCVWRGNRPALTAMVGCSSQMIPQLLTLCRRIQAEGTGPREWSMVVDTELDERLAHLKGVKQQPKIRFYAGVAIAGSGGEKLGTLWVMGPVPQELTPDQILSFQALGRLGESLAQTQKSQGPQSGNPDPPCKLVQPSLGDPDAGVSGTGSRDHNGHRDREWSSYATNPRIIRGGNIELFDSRLERARYRCNATGDRSIRELIHDPILARGENPSANSLSEQNHAQILGQTSLPYVSFIHPEDQTRVEAAMSHALNQGQSFSLDYRLTQVDGTVRWVSDSGSGIFGPGGELLYIDGIIMDKTSNAKSCIPQPPDTKPVTWTTSETEAIAIGENRANAGYFRLDPEWNFTEINPEGEEILGKPRHLLVGKNIWQEFPEWEQSQLIEECRLALQEAQTVTVEAFYLGRCLKMQAYPNDEGLSVYFQNVPPQTPPEDIPLDRDRLCNFSAQIGRLIAKGGTVATLIPPMMTAVVEHLGATSACLWTLNPSLKELELRFNAGRPLDRDLFPERIPLGQTKIGTVAQTRKSYTGCLVWQKNGGQTGLKNCELHPDCLLQPLVIDEQVCGVMAVVIENGVNESIQNLLVWLTSTLAIALDRDRAREALLSRREGLLFRLASQIRNSLDLDTILETAVTEIHSLLQIDRCHFLWYLPHPLQPSLTVTHESRSPDQKNLLCEYPAPLSGPLTQKIRDLESLRSDRLDTEADLDEKTRTLFAEMGILSVLLLPLETRSGQLGAVVCSHSQTRPWTDGEIELLQGVVDQLALAIDQAELYAQTHAAALAAQTQAQQLSVALQNLKQTQAQLIQTEKMSSLGQMVAGIAHEINNPVNFITGNLVHANNYTQDLLHLIEVYEANYPNPVPEVLEVAEDIDLDFLIEDLPKILASMQMGADRIRQIVVSLRNFSRLDEAEMKPVDIHEGIDNTLLILHNRWKPKGKDPGVELIKEYGKLPKVECYAGQLNQVFMNILTNAMDALENQEAPHIIKISTEIAKTDALGNPTEVSIRIRDNGPGMSEEVKKRLFDPFFTTKPVGKGTGLGLSISYKIVVDKHGGLLRCDSEPGQGTEFLIQIPAKQPYISSRCA